MGDEPLQLPAGESDVARGPLTSLQRHFLQRLAYLSALKNVVYETPSQFNHETKEIVLRAKASTMRDCVEQGVGDVAKHILAMVNSTPRTIDSTLEGV